MSRIDMTTRELHGLLAPVLPHVCTDPELPQLCVVRIEVQRGIAYACATDRITLAAARLRLDGHPDDMTIHIGATEAANVLRLFRFDKDNDPRLRITVDQMTISHNGRDRGLMALGLQIDAEDGTRLVLHDRRDPLQANALDNWRNVLGKAVHRDHKRPAVPSLLIWPGVLARWGKSAAKGDRFVMLPGAKPGEPVLVVVEDHFIAIWAPLQHLDGDAAAQLKDNPWVGELPAPLAAAEDQEEVPVP